MKLRQRLKQPSHFRIQPFLVVLFTILACNAFSQKIAVSGYVKDISSGESLPYATVYFPTLSTGITANQYGYFSGLVNPGNVEMVFSYVGYKPETMMLNINADTTLNFLLNPPSLAEVTVHGNRNSTLGSELNRTSIPMSPIKEIPPFLGEYDIIKKLQST